MASNLSRRQFFKAAAGLGVATGFSPTVRRVLLEPFVRPPEQELPGKATWYASTCRQCPAGCGIIVRVINGRARKIEGNPDHPLNRGKLCARGQAGLQLLYNPDRLRNAVRQTGGRNSRRFEAIPWSEALTQLSQAIEQIGDRSRVAFLAGLIPDHLHALATRLLEAIGAPPPVVFDLHTALEGRALAAGMAQRWFGARQLPLYDIANTEVILSFGANFLETWMSPVSQSVDYGVMRQGRQAGRGFLAQFEPRLSPTAAVADEWIPVRPGSEAAIALALGRIIVEENLGRVGSHRDHAHLYRDVSVEAMAESADLPSERLRRLARTFAEADRSVAVPGGYLGGLSNGPQAMDAVMALNVIMRRIGQEGGVFIPHEIPAPRFLNPVLPSPFSKVTDLIERMRSGQVDLLLICGTNPVYELPLSSGFLNGLQSVPQVVSFAPFVDETAVWSDAVLPDHTYLEGWGHQVVSPGADRPAVSSQQPVVRPLYDTRSTADVLLALASRMGGEAAGALPWPDEVAYLEESSAELHGSSIGLYDARTPAGFWSRWRQFGGWWSEKPIREEPEPSGIPEASLPAGTAEFSGSSEDYPYFLLLYPSPALTDGRGANQPWLQEAPDPITTARWNSWVELNPATAAALGVTDNQLVRVLSPHGELQAPVVVHPGIRPDCVAIPLGQGHQDFGRFAAGRGAQAMSLLGDSAVASQTHLKWGATRVRIEPLGEIRPLARLESLDGEGRESLR